MTTAHTITRMDTSTVGRWWWTVDKWMVAAVTLLIVIGVMLNFAAGPPAAERIHASAFHFVRKQMMFLPLVVAVIFSVSLLSPLSVRRFAAVGFVVFGLMVLATLIAGNEVNGARRWLAGGSLQPSEFLKPFFVVVAAWMFSEHRLREDFPGNIIAMGLLLLVAAVLLSQPDVGMTLVVAAVWAAQFFIAGLPMFWVILICVMGMSGIV